MSIRVHPWLSVVFLLLPIAWLWYRLIDHLRIEWAVNPAYGYGWAVPFLCAYLLGKRVVSGPVVSGPVVSGPVVLWSCIFLAFLYAPTRLIQEANPEWRLISWTLAFIVIGITLLLFRFNASTLQRFNVSPSAFVFPLCYFFVAVPWPTLVEGRLIQWLTSANVAVTIELLGLFGIPALQHGNVIEISSGVVGVDEACSGIRSFQATLMLSLFFGELYSLTVQRRVFCVFLGFALSFVFNAGRTLLLTVVASFQGVKAVESWHDPAGITVLVWCFVALWLAALLLKPAKDTARRATTDHGLRTTDQAQGAKTSTDYETTGQQTAGNIEQPTSNIEPRTPKGISTDHATTDIRLQTSDFRPQTSDPRLQTSDFRLRTFASGLIAWLVLVEVGVESWYRAHEKNVPITVAWGVEFPVEKAAFRELPFTEKTRQFLRYDEGRNCAWQEEDSTRWQGIYLRWNPGKIAVHLAKSHTPEVCLSAAGRKMVAKSDQLTFEAGGLRLPFFAYVFESPQDRIHVFYCLWEDRAAGQDFDTESLTYGNRLAPVLAGRRNSGQRTLELAVWGMENQEQAAAAVRKQLEKLIRPQPGE